MLTPAQKQQLFGNAPNVDLWIGTPQVMTPKSEAVPFKYDALEFAMMFMHPTEYVAASEVAGYSRRHADGYMPHPSARLVKFLRADAVDSVFDPRAWQLTHRSGIFELGSVLADALGQHQLGLPQTEEYFYKPSDKRLANFYARIFSKSSQTGGFQGFKPILVPTGEFYGYKK